MTQRFFQAITPLTLATILLSSQVSQRQYSHFSRHAQVFRGTSGYWVFFARVKSRISIALGSKFDSWIWFQLYCWLTLWWLHFLLTGSSFLSIIQRPDHNMGFQPTSGFKRFYGKGRDELIKCIHTSKPHSCWRGRLCGEVGNRRCWEGPCAEPQVGPIPALGSVEYSSVAWVRLVGLRP